MMVVQTIWTLKHLARFQGYVMGCQFPIPQLWLFLHELRIAPETQWQNSQVLKRAKDE